jgi:hypothetical protein
MMLMRPGRRPPSLLRAAVSPHAFHPPAASPSPALHVLGMSVARCIMPSLPNTIWHTARVRGHAEPECARLGPKEVWLLGGVLPSSRTVHPNQLTPQPSSPLGTLALGDPCTISKSKVSSVAFELWHVARLCHCLEVVGTPVGNVV